jgi:hypothetical protein
MEDKNSRPTKRLLKHCSFAMFELAPVNDLFVRVVGVHPAKPQIDHDVFDFQTRVLCQICGLLQHLAHDDAKNCAPAFDHSLEAPELFGMRVSPLRSGSTARRVASTASGSNKIDHGVDAATEKVFFLHHQFPQK